MNRKCIFIMKTTFFNNIYTISNIQSILAIFSISIFSELRDSHLDGLSNTAFHSLSSQRLGYIEVVVTSQKGETTVKFHNSWDVLL